MVWATVALARGVFGGEFREGGNSGTLAEGGRQWLVKGRGIKERT